MKGEDIVCTWMSSFLHWMTRRLEFLGRGVGGAIGVYEETMSKHLAVGAL